MSGPLELAGLAFAVFPIVVSLLEHYQDGYEMLGDWIFFRREYSQLLNQLKTEQIVFKQHVEGLLRSVNDSEFDVKRMIDDPTRHHWENPTLSIKLRQKLSGDEEFEIYTASLGSIYESLEYMARRLEKCQPPVNIAGTIIKGHQLHSMFRRLQFSLRKHRWHEKVADLGRQIDRLGKMAGNAEALAPARQSRNSRIPHIFAQLKSQANSLHKAIVNSWTCDCRNRHSFKLVLKRTALGNEIGNRKLQVWFPMSQRIWSKSQTQLFYDDEWRATEARAIPCVSDVDSAMMRGERTDTESRTSMPSTVITSVSSLTVPSTGHEFLWRDSITNEPPSEKESIVLKTDDPGQIFNLCERLKKKDDEACLGYISDGQGLNHVLDLSAGSLFRSAEFDQIVSLKAILDKEMLANRNGRGGMMEIPRRARMSVALTLARTLLELCPTPWLPSQWSKRDVYFFQKKNGVVVMESPFLLCEATSAGDCAKQKRPPHDDAEDRLDHSAALQSLGIIILELWFGRSIESNTFWQKLCGPDGEEHEYTSFNAAVTWQKRAQEEGGLPLHNITQRCIFINFGVTSRDLGNKELVQAVYDGVVKELESLMMVFFGTTDVC